MDMAHKTTAYHKADVYSIESWYDVNDKTHKILSTEKLAYRILLRHGNEREEILHVLQALGALNDITVLGTTDKYPAADGLTYCFMVHEKATLRPYLHVRVHTEIAGYGV